MEEEEEMFPPFWLQTSDSIRQGHRPLRRSTSSVLFSSGSFVLVLLAIALVFIFFVIPSVLNFTSQIFRPHLVKKGWDSLNLVLVLFAIVCGFLSRNTTNDNNVSTPTSYDLQDHQTVFNNASMEVQKSNPSSPRRWYDQYADRTAYINSTTTSTNSMNRGVRTSSSYPDLRQQETSWNVSRDERWRFYDDTHVTNYRVSGSDQLHHHRRRHSWQEETDNVQTKNIPVDTFVVRPEKVSAHRQIPTQSDPLPPPPPRSPSPPPPHKATKRTYQAVGGKENSATKDNLDIRKNLPPPPSRPPPSPPSPPPLPPKEVDNKRSAGNNVKKRGVATTKEFLITSLRRKKKKQRQKSVENFDTFLSASASSSLLPPPSPPPPPPPLPPPSVFHNLFSSKKSNKPKKLVHSIPQPPSSPPPPPSSPPPLITSTTRLSKTRPQIRPMMTTQKPPLPVKASTFNNGDDDNANSGGDSPMVGIPPPPPMPPFGMPEMKFVVVQGDFVRIKSNNSSRSGSPDLDDGSDDQDSVSSPTMEAVASKSPFPLESGESSKDMFCPSPDVNTKADTFIARFRAGLRLEKMNSVKEKQGRGKSNLGPDTREEEEGPSY